MACWDRQSKLVRSDSQSSQLVSNEVVYLPVGISINSMHINRIRQVSERLKWENVLDDKDSNDFMGILW